MNWKSDVANSKMKIIKNGTIRNLLYENEKLIQLIIFNSHWKNIYENRSTEEGIVIIGNNSQIMTMSYIVSRMAGLYENFMHLIESAGFFVSHPGLVERGGRGKTSRQSYKFSLKAEDVLSFHCKINRRKGLRLFVKLKLKKSYTKM